MSYSYDIIKESRHEVADTLEVLCRKGQYYGLKVHFFGLKSLPSRQ